MEQLQSTKKVVSKIKVRMVNGLLLCRKVETEEKIGSIYLTSEDGGTDIRDSVIKKAEIMKVAPKATHETDNYSEGDVVVYAKGAREEFIWFDDVQYFFLDKKQIRCVEEN